jgi:folate-binding protein YgfZ
MMPAEGALREALARSGARFVGDEAVSFGDPAGEAAAALSGSVLADRSALGRIRVTGKDRLDLLHRLTTNALTALRPGEGALTALLTPKGRIVDLLHACVLEDHLLLVTSDGSAGKIRDWIERFVFREEVRLEPDACGSCLGVYGRAAPGLLQSATGAGQGALAPGHSRAASLAGREARVVGTHPLGGCGFLILCEDAAAAWRALVEAGATPCGAEALERLRIAAGVPRLGADLGEDLNPWEAALDAAVRLDKGCYVGQEVVARLRTYQKVQRRLAGIRLDGPGLPAPGARVLAGGAEAGILTSVACEPGTGSVLALALIQVDTDPAAPLEVGMPDGSRIAAQRARLPFLDPPPDRT